MKLNAKNFAKFLKGKVGINCTTRVNAELLFGILKMLKVKWSDSDYPIDNNDWEDFEEDTIYIIDESGITNECKECSDIEMIIM